VTSQGRRNHRPLLRVWEFAPRRRILGAMDHKELPSETEPTPLQPDVVEPVDEETEDGTYISEPSKLIRIASMTRAMLEEVRQMPLDEAGSTRLLEVYHSSLEQLREVLSDDLQEELGAMFQPLTAGSVSESELRIVQAQLVGWLEGLFHGIQASLWSQQASVNAQLQEMARRKGLESGEEHKTPGMYL